MPNHRKHTKQMTANEIEKYFQWFTRQTSEIRTAILKHFENEHAHKTFSQSQGDEALARTIQQVQNEIRMSTQRKNQNRDLEPLSHIQNMRLAMIHQNCRKKGKPTYQAIKKHINTIVDLRLKGVSWRDIAEYLVRFCELKVSFSYLRRAYNEIKTEEHDRIGGKSK